jgi:hypothetical protein
MHDHFNSNTPEEHPERFVLFFFKLMPLADSFLWYSLASDNVAAYLCQIITELMKRSSIH